MRKQIAKCLFGALFTMSTIVVMAQKPILPDFHADPSAHQWDGKYWIYPSTDEPGSKSWRQMKRWSCYSSTDLAEWKNEGQILSIDDISWATDAAFAPDAMKHNGKYYFFFPASFKIGVATSDKPNGPFKDALGKPLIEKEECKGVLSIDPCIFIDDDKTPYLYYGNRRAGMVQLTDDLLSKVGEPKMIQLPKYHEGIWVHKRNDLYYFTYPWHTKEADGTIRQRLVCCTAPTPHGPFTYHGPFFDNKSRNSHHSIIEIEGQWYLFYHIQGPSAYERRVCVEYLEYDEKGMIKEIFMTKEGIKPLSKKRKK